MNDVKVDSNDIEEMYIKYYTPLKRYCMKLVSYNSRYTVIAYRRLSTVRYAMLRILPPVRTSMDGLPLVVHTICCHTFGKPRGVKKSSASP